MMYAFFGALLIAVLCALYCQPWATASVTTSWSMIAAFCGMWLFGAVAFLLGIIWLFFVWFAHALL